MASSLSPNAGFSLNSSKPGPFTLALMEHWLKYNAMDIDIEYHVHDEMDEIEYTSSNQTPATPRFTMPQLVVVSQLDNMVMDVDFHMNIDLQKGWERKRYYMKS